MKGAVKSTLMSGPLAPATRRGLALWAPVVLYMALIFYVSSRPDVSIPEGRWISDKSTHVLAYAALGVLFVRALVGGLPARITSATALLAVALTTAYGATDEFHQLFVPGRNGELLDLTADAIGAVLGVSICCLWGIISPAPSDVEGPSRDGL